MALRKISPRIINLPLFLSSRFYLKKLSQGRTLKSGAGFTLIEIVITMALLLSILSLGTFMSLDAYRGYAFRSERSLLVSILLRARALSMNNMDGVSHGVCYAQIGGTNYYVTFNGTTCNPSALTSSRIEANPAITVTGLSVATPVTFTQLSGTTTDNGITLHDGIHADTAITINHVGTIHW